MTLLQNAAMRKTLGVVKGTSGRKANTVAAVEDVETFAKAVTISKKKFRRDALHLQVRPIPAPHFIVRQLAPCI